MFEEKSIISVLKLAPEFLGNIVMTGWHIGRDYQFNWYIQMLTWLYVFSPIFYVLISRRGGEKLIVVSYAIILTSSMHTTIMGTSRIPICLFGMLMADFAERKMKVKMLIMYIAMFIGIALLGVLNVMLPFEIMDGYGWFWLPFILIVPGLCATLIGIFECLAKIELVGNIITQALKLVGKASFEIYLIHIFVFQIAQKYIGTIGNDMLWLGAIVVAVFLGMTYKYIVDYVRKKMIEKEN